MPRCWRVANCDAARVAQLEREAGVPTIVAHLLLARGIDSPDAVRRFLEPKLNDVRDPELLPGVAAAADLILAAIRERQPIAIYGDYDADGMTASAIMLRCLRMLGATPRLYVPHRFDEGYGLHADALRTLAAEGMRVVITVDCGIASVAEAEVARELGLQLIVTDHHNMAAKLPPAAAIVHPQLPGSDYPFAGLCGAAVAFKLAWALCVRTCGSKRVTDAMRQFLLDAVGLAAIGTVADVVPLVDENRALVRDGLDVLTRRPPLGIAALRRAAGQDEKSRLTAEDIGFALAPRLNAAGRLGQAELAVELLVTESPTRANELAEYISGLNQQRQSIERSVLLSAGKQIKDRFDPQQHAALVLADHDWHAGVIGIVAGKLAERYHRPVVLIALDKVGVAPGTGSGRSVPGIDLHRALHDCTAHLLGHGGHAAAAGLKIEAHRVDAFRSAFCEAVTAQAQAGLAAADVAIDAEAIFSMLTAQTLRAVERLAPFGNGNRRPVFYSSGVRLAGPPRRMGQNDRHLTVDLEQDGLRLRGVSFGNGEWADELASIRTPLDIAYQPVINTFRGAARVELHLTDWRLSAT